MDRQFCGLNFRLKMGKRRHLNKFISKWIKSDLPEDRSTVLLLGVTRIPTSPLPARRPCTLPLDPNLTLSSTPSVESNSQKSSTAQSRRTSFSTRRRQTKSSSIKRRPEKSDDSTGKCSSSSWENPNDDDELTSPSSNCVSGNENAFTETVMDRSVDSIGTCSLDVEASADLSDWSEASSGGTLRSASIKTPTTEPHLPSYLSLACTVNGYSTTTNYDPVRLARSRDTSPHRLDNDNLTPKNLPTYSIQNNLLSPPNLVPLPTHIKPKMADHTLTHHYQSTKTMTFQKHTESHHFASKVYTKDTIDACYDHKNLTNKCLNYDTKNYSSKMNGQSKTTVKEFASNTETKSFIEQRVERLYGPGALAQGFFVSKRQKYGDSESENENLFGEQNGTESPMKQSNSSPALPVLRHLRPEFRAQLPILSPRKGVENSMQKSSTVPTLKDEVKVNGHSKQIAASEGDNVAKMTIKEETGEKDGHYFLKILQNETNRLLQSADKVDSELSNNELSEEIVGKIHSASGKARLLVSQKMQQFKGLCTNNITQSENEAFPTTNEDLQGFWDMVMLQVDQVDALFKEIETLKANNWQEVKPEPVNVTNGKAKKVVNRVKPMSAASEEARKKREAQRKHMIEERRKAMKAQKPLESIEIFVPESS
ncbi:uncharacterized protein LOC123011795 [Tribolium madens]|uniref:uncharacterized protein LOC123011795 n=1 Tax=Tribolium madens TaxID=41895 RepID=UPI001CF74A42|nr:uncharacterized protein LOC123011795 [Tribolium madens]